MVRNKYNNQRVYDFNDNLKLKMMHCYRNQNKKNLCNCQGSKKDIFTQSLQKLFIPL